MAQKPSFGGSMVSRRVGGDLARTHAPTKASSPAAAKSSSGPVVTRRVGGDLRNPGKAPSGRLRPSVRETIESMVSSGSQSEYFNADQTIILFDWDDTVCPSNWIRENRPTVSFFKPAPSDERFQKPLRELQKHAEAMLRSAMLLGKVVIVTNAMEPWVDTSCRNFLPSLLPIVSQLPVIYARSIYDSHCDPQKGRSLEGPGMYSATGQNKLASYNTQMFLQDEMAPQRWKELAFDQEISGFYSRYSHQSWKNIISIGDSIFERDAVRRVVLNRPTKKKCRTKTAKLLDEPEIGELIAQVQVIHESLGLMVQYDGNLDIEIDEEDLKLDLAFADKILDR